MRPTTDSDAVLSALLERVPGSVAVVDPSRTIRAANAEFRSRCASEPVGRRCHEVLHSRREPCAWPDVECPLVPPCSPEDVESRPSWHWHQVGSGWRHERVLMEPILGAKGQVAACLARFWPGESRERVARLPVLRDLELDVRPIRAGLRRLALSQRPMLLVGEAGMRIPRVAVAVHRLSRRRGAFEERDAGELTRGRLGELLLAEPRPRGAGTLLVQDIHELDTKGWRALAAWVGDGPPADRRGWRLVASTDRPAEELARDPVAASVAAVLARCRLRVPPLRERKREIPLLSSRLIRQISGRDLPLSAETQARLERYSFPGNLDELEQALRHALVLATGAEVRPEHLPDWIAAGG